MLTILVYPVGIDNTASYFGDVHLKPGDIDNIVENVFDLGNGRTLTSLPLDCKYDQCSGPMTISFPLNQFLPVYFLYQITVVIRRLQSNPYIKRFLSGKPRQQVHFKVDVEVLTEIEPTILQGVSPKTSAPMTPIPTKVQPGENRSIDKENNPTTLRPQTNELNKLGLQTPVAPTRSSSGLDESCTRSSSGLDESWTSFFSQNNNKSRDPPSTIHIYHGDHYVDSPLSFVRGLDPPSFLC